MEVYIVTSKQRAEVAEGLHTQKEVADIVATTAELKHYMLCKLQLPDALFTLTGIYKANLDQLAVSTVVPEFKGMRLAFSPEE